jgi:asparagine synthase (glutamine-hydrolysing)
MRFPFNTPLTKEAYYYRSEFERHFPEPQTAELVPGGPTVACSTSAAVEWDAAWIANLDPSGRAVLGVHGAKSKVPRV